MFGWPIWLTARASWMKRSTVIAGRADLGPQDLDRGALADHRVRRAVDHAHAAVAELAVDDVAADLGAGTDAHADRIVVAVVSVRPHRLDDVGQSLAIAILDHREILQRLEKRDQRVAICCWRRAEMPRARPAPHHRARGSPRRACVRGRRAGTSRSGATIWTTPRPHSGGVRHSTPWARKSVRASVSGRRCRAAADRCTDGCVWWASCGDRVVAGHERRHVTARHSRSRRTGAPAPAVASRGAAAGTAIVDTKNSDVVELVVADVAPAVGLREQLARQAHVGRRTRRRSARAASARSPSNRTGRSRVACCSGSHTRLTRPEMPSPSASSGSASAASVASGTASRSRARSRRAPGRYDIRASPGRNEPSGSRDIDPRLAQQHDLAIAVAHRRLDPRQRHVHLGQADGRVVLQLQAEARGPGRRRRGRRASPSVEADPDQRLREAARRCRSATGRARCRRGSRSTRRC